MPDPVVITRPLAQAGSLAERVQSLGREAVIFPLLEIHPLADPTPLQRALESLDGYAMAAFVSPNAIEAAFAYIDTWPSSVALAVMGEGSRAALARRGLCEDNAAIFYPQDAERTDSETLLKVLDWQALRGKQVLIVRGETGRELLADELRSAGVHVTQVAAYRRAAPQASEALLRQLEQLMARRPDWIVTSSEALRILVSLAEQIDGQSSVAKIQQARLLVPHARIAQTAHGLGFADVTMTGSGDERLLAALQF